MMKQEYIFPVLLIALNIGSAIFYAFSKDWRMVIYWVALEEIRFEGVIGKSLDIHWSTKLSMMSLSSIVGCLSKTVSGQTITLPTTARATYDNATISGSWDNLVKQYTNWTFAYA